MKHKKTSYHFLSGQTSISAKKNKILSKDQELCAFINSMSNLISYKLDELYKAEIKTVEQLEKEEIEKALDKQQENIQNNKDYSEELRTELMDKVEQRRQNIDKLAEAECYKDMASKIVDQGKF